MGLFLSTYQNKLDKKGRVSIPAPYRAVLGESAFHGVVAYASFISPCIEASAWERTERMAARIETLDPFSDERDAFATTILGGSHQLAFDQGGRVLLPEPLIELAQIRDQIIFVGKGETFEVWEPKQFKEHARRTRELAREKRLELRAAPKGGPV